MELSREEVYKNKKVSLGVTLLSFIVMLGFFIFTKFISTNSSSINPEFSQLELGMSSFHPGNTPSPEGIISSSAFVKSKSTSGKISSSEGEVVLQNTANKISYNYKNAVFKENIAASPDTLKASKNNSTVAYDVKTGDSLFGFYLPERSVVTKPSFSNSATEQGKVVVEVIVDKNGTVVEANPNGRGTNTSSSTLKNEAKRMALATVFNKDQKSEEQRGTITIIFSFN